MLALSTVACTQKTEKKIVIVPELKSIDVEEIMENALYNSKDGFECEIENLRTNEISNIFYYEKLDTGIDLLEHSFLPIIDNSKKLKGKINIDEYQFGNVQYKSDADEVYKGSSMASGSKSFSSANIIFDSKVNEFDLEIIKFELVNDRTEEVENNSVARITNCKAEVYKVHFVPNI